MRKETDVERINKEGCNYCSKIAVVTGATGGIGKALIHVLAQRGALVIAVARNKQKFRKMIKDFSRDLTLEQIDNIELIEADLSNMKEIQQVAIKIERQYEKVDILINNVGGYFSKRTETVDQFEQTLALNYLGHVVLTFNLLPLLEKSPQANIVEITSVAHYNGKIKFDDIALKNHYFGLKAYSQSKLAQMICVKDLAEKVAHTNIRINGVHPGVVKTNIGQSGFSLEGLVVKLLKKTIAIKPDKAAKMILRLIDSQKFNNLTGAYISKTKEKKPNKLIEDDLLRLKFCNITLDMLKQWIRTDLALDYRIFNTKK